MSSDKYFKDAYENKSSSSSNYEPPKSSPQKSYVYKPALSPPCPKNSPQKLCFWKKNYQDLSKVGL